jgi:hypothetical protein
VIGVGHTSRLKMANGSLPLRWLVCPLWSPLMIFLVSLDLSHQYFFYDTNNVIIKVLICFRDLFSFFSPVSLTNYNEDKRERERERETKKILKVHQNINDDIINTAEKISKIWIQRHQKILSTIIGVGHTSHPKASESLVILDGSCDLSLSPLVTVLDDVGFVSSRSFWQFQWYHH